MSLEKRFIDGDIFNHIDGALNQVKIDHAINQSKGVLMRQKLI